MRWNDLFADLEAQLAAAADSQFVAEVADRTRGERASVTLESRLAATVGKPVVVTLLDGERVAGDLADAASSWLLISAGARQTWIPAAAVAGISGLGERSLGLSPVSRRLSMGHALRALSRDRSQVLVATQAGQWRGVIVTVGADYVNLHDREANSQMSVPFTAILRVSSAGNAA